MTHSGPKREIQKLIIFTNQVIEKLPFDEEKLITDESPVEVLQLKQSIEI